MPLIGLHDRRLVIHDQYECPFEGHHGEGLVARVEDQCAHAFPFEKGWTASSHSNYDGRRVRSEQGTKKGAVTMTTPDRPRSVLDTRNSDLLD
jgi:hypothetical protein